MFNLIDNKSKIYINHSRVYFGEKAIDFYNPLNIVLDYKTRDLAEYGKSAFMSGKNIIIDNLKFLRYEDWLSYFSRVLFPSFYFDQVDQYISFGKKMDEKRISLLANSFEQVLRDLYNTISMQIKAPYIDWLSNVDNI